MAVSSTESIPNAVSADLSWRLVRPAGRAGDIVAFDEAVVTFFLEAATLLGVPKSVAAIYGICFASAEPLGFTEINDRLDISSGSISQGLKLLREVGALKVVTAPLEKRDGRQTAEGGRQTAEGGRRTADKRDYYTPDLELRKLVSHFIGERLEKQLKAGKGRLKTISAQVPAGNGTAKVLKSRVKALQTWHDKGASVLPLVKAFLQLP